MPLGLVCWGFKVSILAIKMQAKCEVARVQCIASVYCG